MGQIRKNAFYTDINIFTLTTSKSTHQGDWMSGILVSCICWSIIVFNHYVYLFYSHFLTFKPQLFFLVTDGRHKRYVRLNFHCGINGRHCLYGKQFFILNTKLPKTWIHLMFLAVQVTLVLCV